MPKLTARWFALIVIVLMLGGTGMLTLALKDKPEVLVPAITGLFGFGSGILSGYGFKSKTSV